MSRNVPIALSQGSGDKKQHPGTNEGEAVFLLEKGVEICDDFWCEFMNFAKLLVKYKEDSDIYDVFNLMREMNGEQPYSVNFLARVDKEIEREEARQKGQALVYG